MWVTKVISMNAIYAASNFWYCTQKDPSSYPVYWTNPPLI
jgi:hypothetical protein